MTTGESASQAQLRESIVRQLYRRSGQPGRFSFPRSLG